LTMFEGELGALRRGEAVARRFAEVSPNDWHDAVVTGIKRYGIFVKVTLADGSAANGMVHISEIKEGKVECIQDEAEVGQSVKVRVLEVSDGKISLSFRAQIVAAPEGDYEQPDFTPFQGLSSDQWLKGKVARVASFGAFVDVTSPDGGSSAEGLVHVTAIREGFTGSASEALEVGQEVSVRVLSVDVDNGSMGLSMKEETEDLWQTRKPGER